MFNTNYKPKDNKEVTLVNTINQTDVAIEELNCLRDFVGELAGEGVKTPDSVLLAIEKVQEELETHTNYLKELLDWI